MSKVARADWAASVPWGGVIGKPDSFGADDIGQLSASGFSVGQVPWWNGTKFVGYTIPSSPSPTPSPVSPLPPQTQILWDVPSIMPLQSVYEDFPLIGAIPGEPISHGVAFDPGFCLTFAYVFQNDSIRLKVVNMDSSSVDLPSALWSIQRMSA